MPRLLRTALTAARVAVFRASRGRALASIAGLPVLLATAGRAYSRQRTMLLLYVEDDGALMVAAPDGGNDLGSGWYHDLVPAPAVKVRSRSGVQTMQARLADGRDRRHIIDRIAAQSSQHARDQRNADRAIPVVLLRPVLRQNGQDRAGAGRPEAA